MAEWRGMEEEEQEEESNGSKNMAEHLPTKDGCQLIKGLYSLALPHKSFCVYYGLHSDRYEDVNAKFDSNLRRCFVKD